MSRVAEDTQLFQLITVERDLIRYEARTVAGALYDAFDLVKREGQPNQIVERAVELEERRRPQENVEGDESASDQANQ